MADRTPALSLDTMHEGIPITIDGARYEIRNASSLSLGTLKAIDALQPRTDELFGKKELSDEETSELSSLLQRVCELLVDAPAALLAKLSDIQRIAICQAFTQLRPTTPATTGAKPLATTRPRSPGKKSSPD